MADDFGHRTRAARACVHAAVSHLRLLWRAAALGRSTREKAIVSSIPTDSIDRTCPHLRSDNVALTDQHDEDVAEDDHGVDDDSDENEETVTVQEAAVPRREMSWNARGVDYCGDACEEDRRTGFLGLHIVTF
ncbi:hypothetical protein PsYK624_156790 [Phanerochaete sordida]|uniref:Uncharacterized protein n=1 Tax=Phanerochaete sordida TaxID=48140 RepID=A0A9P3LMJ4_9APHY|nr:hypothetical protein PsYK624_156790 [Phanerochaete sordida]